MKQFTKTEWDRAYRNGRKFSPIKDSTLDLLKLRGDSILDIGCGQGYLMQQLRSRGFDPQGIDLSSYSADMVGNFLEVDLPNYDIIFANLVLAFNPMETFLREVKKHLNKNGQFILITPIRYKGKVYDQHWINISVDYDELTQSLEIFNYKLVYKNKGIYTYKCTLPD